MTNYIRGDPLTSTLTTNQGETLPALEVLLSTVIITQGETIAIEVPHTYSEQAVTPALDINLMQPGLITDLTFVTINDDEPDSSLVTIDTSAEEVGIYTLELWSFSTLDPGVTIWMNEILKEDSI